METSSQRTKVLLILTIALLAISVGVAVFVVSMTVREVHHFQQQHTLAVHKDVHAIRPWMTLTYISRFYHIPEPYLVRALHLKDTRNADRLPIQTLAQHNSRSVTQVTNDLQAAITTYDREHSSTPTSHHTSKSPPSTLLFHTPHPFISRSHTQISSHVPTTRLHFHTTVRSVRI